MSNPSSDTNTPSAPCESSQPASDLWTRWPASELLQANLEAMTGQNAPLAQTIRNTPQPSSGRQAVANDGAPTFRIRRPDGRFDWLGFCSTPLLYAEAHSRKVQPAKGNLVIDGVGSGAILQAILKKLPLYQALLVTETNPLNYRLIFQLYDFTPWLRSGQLVPLLGSNRQQMLLDFFESQPGYNIADQVINQVFQKDSENQAFAQTVTITMEQCLNLAASRHAHLIQQMQAWDQKTTWEEIHRLFKPDQRSSLRAANITNTLSRIDYAATRDAMAGLRDLNVKTDPLALERPDQVSVWAQLERLNRVRPHLILLIDSFRRDFPYSLGEKTISATLLRTPSPNLFQAESKSADRMGPADVVFALTNEQRNLLIQAGFPSPRTAVLPLFANPEIYHPLDLPADTPLQADVALLADRCSTEPSSYGIHLPFQQRLLQLAMEEIRRRPEEFDPSRARRYLLRAQESGIVLKEKDLQEHFTELLEKFMGPAILCDTCCQSLQAAGVCLKIWGWAKYRTPDAAIPEYWHESPAQNAVTGTLPDGPELNELFHAVPIHLYLPQSDTPESLLWNGIAAGAFFLIRSRPQSDWKDRLKPFYQKHVHEIFFRDHRELVQKVHYFLAHPQKRMQIADAARQAFLETASASHAMRQMLDWIQANFPAG